MTVTDHTVLTLAVLAALSAPVSPARADDKGPPNSSTFRYVDEKRPARVYPVPPPDTDPTGLVLAEMRAHTTALEERVERLEAVIARLAADLAGVTRPDPKERRP